MDDRGESLATAHAADEELIARVAAGCHESVSALHRRHASRIAGVVHRSLGREGVEEVVQDVFVAAWRKAATFDPSRGSFRTWLLRIARRRVLNELRNRGRRPRIAPDPEGARLGREPDSGPGPEEAAWNSQRSARVRDAMAALPYPQRQALTLAFLHELTHEQVAASLGLPLGTAKSRIRAGMQGLRARLAPLAAAGLVVLAALAIGLAREGVTRSTLRRQEAALRLVTTSDVIPLRLEATSNSDAPPEAHGHYRGRRRAEVAVITLSKLPPPPEGLAYRVWGWYGDRWLLLGDAEIDAEGHALLVAQGRHLATPPASLKVTLEARRPPDRPGGRVVLSWPVP